MSTVSSDRAAAGQTRVSGKSSWTSGTRGAPPAWLQRASHLAPMKVTPMVTLAGCDDARPARRSLAPACSLCCPHGCPQPATSVWLLGCRNLLLTPSMNPDRRFMVRTFHYLSHAASRRVQAIPALPWRHVLSDDAVQLAVERTVHADQLPDEADSAAAGEHEQLVRRRVLHRAESALSALSASVSSTLVRAGVWLLLNLFGRCFQTVRVDKSQLEVLRHVRAVSPGTPLLLLPLHRSRLDACLISLVLVSSDLPPPLLVLGEDDAPRSWALGWLLRRLGCLLPLADRQEGDLCAAILASYVCAAMRAGHDVLVSVEPTRSRSGRPLAPSAAPLLDAVVKSHQVGRLEDAYIVPVAVSYDRVLDADFIGEQLGGAKRPNTLRSALATLWSMLCGHSGSVCVDFAEPFRLSEFVTSVAERPSAATAVSLAAHALYTTSSNAALMSTQLVAVLLLYRFRQGCTLTALIAALDRLCTELRLRGVNLGFSGPASLAAEHALAVLGPGLVTRERVPSSAQSTSTCLLRPVTILPNVLELAYCASQALQPLLADALVATALLSGLPPDLLLTCSGSVDAVRQQLLPRRQLLASVADLSDLLGAEQLLVVPACQQLEKRLMTPISALTEAEVLQSPQSKPVDDDEAWAGRVFSRFKDMEFSAEADSSGDEGGARDGGGDGRDLVWTVHVTTDSREKLLLQRALLAPVVDTHYVTASCLLQLLDRELDQADFVVDVLYEIRQKLSEGLLTYGESMSAEAIRAALRTFTRWGVLDGCTQGNVRLIYLSQRCNNEHTLQQLISHIHSFK